MKKLALVSALLTLSACASPTTPSGPRADWRCDGGAAFSMRLKEDGNAEVFAGGQLYNLPGVPAGSGTRYTNGAVEYWERGGEAMLNGAAGGPYTNCRRA
ncbi:MAG: MliC family protein [Hyphomonadaceae bacterium]|nr:MliC family protein [Hyphomonadaceae bacterium]